MNTTTPALTQQSNAIAPVVAIEGLRVEFNTDQGPVVSVKDVSFAIQPGETVCVVGESGSGKSVTSLSLMRLVEFSGGRIAAGHIRFTKADGAVVDLTKTSEAAMREIRGGEIGMIFQEPMTSLNPVFTIGKQLTDGLIAHGRLSQKEADARAIELLRSVRIPEPERRLRQYPHELSGGMRQRVVIAMAMACHPRLLIADEPTTALDVTIQAEILALIDQLKRDSGTAVLFITHDMAVVAQMADRVVVMYRGNIVEQGSVQAIFEQPRHDYTRALLAAVPSLGAMRGKLRPEPMPILGAPMPCLPTLLKDTPSVSAQQDSELLRVEHLCVRFPVRSALLRRPVANVHAVEDVSFSIKAGETFSLVGESGSGKSSCGRAILRLIEASSGTVTLAGQTIGQLDASHLRRARRDMQMVFQDPYASLNPYRRLRDQVAEPLVNFGMASGSDLDARIAELFDRVELPRDLLRRFPHEVSGGQRQRIAIARALATHPKLIVADEAVSALDVSVRAQILNLMMRLQADLGLSFLFISHDMAVVERISHQVAVMYLGRIVEIGPRAAIFDDPRHSYTKSLLAAVPLPDPRRRQLRDEARSRPAASPVFPIHHAPSPSRYEEVRAGHFVLRET